MCIYIYISMYIMSYYIYVILKKNIRIYMNKDINTLSIHIYIYSYEYINTKSINIEKIYIICIQHIIIFIYFSICLAKTINPSCCCRKATSLTGI